MAGEPSDQMQFYDEVQNGAPPLWKYPVAPLCGLPSPPTPDLSSMSLWTPIPCPPTPDICWSSDALDQSVKEKVSADVAHNMDGDAENGDDKKDSIHT